VAIDFKTIANDKRFIACVIVIAVLLVAWAMWPGGKPPDRCPNSPYRPGELIREFGRAGVRIMGSDCKPSATQASEQDIAAAQERMANWQRYEAEQMQSAFGKMPGSGMGSSFSLLGTGFSIMNGPIGTFFLLVAGAWAVLFAIALFFFLIGFLIAAVFGLRHAPLSVIAAPVLIWWKVLIEIPTSMVKQVTQLSIASQEARAQLQQSWWQMLKVIMGLAPPPQSARPITHGSAEFATHDEITARSALDAQRQHQAAINIGEVQNRPATWYTDKHVLLMAGSRAGKGRDIIIPNLLRYPGSTFVIDPKGENYERTGRYRSTLGTVRVLDPWQVTEAPSAQRAVFNPLALLHSDNPDSVDMADVLAHSLIIPSGNDTHWSESARALSRALILHVATSPEFASRRDLICVRTLLLTEFDDAKEKAQAQTPDGASLLKRMVLNTSFGGIVSDFAMSFLGTPSRERGSIISHAARQTDFLDTPALRKSLSVASPLPHIDFAEWRRGVMSCYVCIPADKLEGSGLRWVRLVLSTAINEMISRFDPPALPVQFILDELASLRRLEQIERAIGLAAGYGVQIWAVWQDIAQMQDLYQSRWASFIGNAGVRYVFGVSDYNTAKYFSDFMGQYTQEIVTNQTDAGGVRVSSVSRSLHARALMTPDEIMVMDGRTMLVLPDRFRPVIAKRKAWFDDEALKTRAAQ